MDNQNVLTRWALIDDESRACREFTTTSPAGRFHPSLRWLPVPENLLPFADHAYTEKDGQIAPPSLAYLQAQLKSLVTAARWQHEASGIQLQNGMHLLTAKDDQERVNSLLANMERFKVAEVDFKAASGWVRVSYDEAKGMGEAIMQHVQACFSAERLHHDGIDALDSVAAIASYDYTPGWPDAAR